MVLLVSFKASDFLCFLFLYIFHPYDRIIEHYPSMIIILCGHTKRPRKMLTRRGGAMQPPIIGVPLDHTCLVGGQKQQLNLLTIGIRPEPSLMTSSTEWKAKGRLVIMQQEVWVISTWNSSMLSIMTPISSPPLPLSTGKLRKFNPHAAHFKNPPPLINKQRSNP